MLTQAFDGRCVLVAQAPFAAVALVGLARALAELLALEEGWTRSLRRTLPANACLGLLFGALVGALFLAVLLVISVWDHSRSPAPGSSAPCPWPRWPCGRWGSRA